MNVIPPAEILGGIVALRVSKLRVPIWLAVGQYERISDTVLVEHAVDIRAEMERRGMVPRELL